MVGLELVIVAGILLLVGGIVFYMIRSERSTQKTKLTISKALGFTPVDPDIELGHKIAELYKHIRIGQSSSSGEYFEFQNVARKSMLDGEIVIFDLIDTSGEDDNFMERQAVAIISPHMNLPTFVIFPKTDLDGAVANVANKLVGWIISKVGNLVTFPHHPEFEKRYLVSSDDPEGTKRFLDEYKLQQLAHTRLYGIHAGGDMFTLSRIDLAGKSLTLEMMGERVNQAMGVLSIFLS